MAVKAKTKANGHPDKLTLKQERFAKEYARNGNGTGAAKKAGYKGSDPALATIAWENLRKPDVHAAVQQECARIEHEIDYSAGRVRRRLDALSHGAEGEGQYATAVRAEELLGKAAGMFIDQSIQLRGDLSGDHLAALIEVARGRQAQPLDLGQSEQSAGYDHRITAIMESTSGGKK
jgi:hypothetical protein